MAEGDKEIRVNIPERESRKLWVLAGGRCEFCNQYLLEDEFSNHPVNLGERAHIVGATNAPGSPRGRSDLSLTDRAKAQNLMLMCGDHHDVIDELVEEHTVEGLSAMKAAHEARIRLLTGMGADRQSVVLRVFGDIRGGPTSLPRNVVQQAVIAAGRYPDYRLAPMGEDIELDLRHRVGEGEDLYWRTCVAQVAAEAERIHRAQDSIDHLSVFALARIPILVALGFYLDDKLEADVFQRDRGGSGDKKWHLGSDGPTVKFAASRIQDGESTSDQVAIAFSVSASISGDVVKQVGGDTPVYEIRPDSSAPGRDALSAKSSIEDHANTYHEVLERIESEHPECGQILIFAATPVVGAIQIGRGIMKDAQPALSLYDRDKDGKFSHALLLER